MKRRILSIATALALIWSLCPTWAFAAEPEADTGLCPHHPEHTAECGYIAPTEGQPCAHEHTDECYTEETSCVHVHDEGCYSDGVLPGEGEDQDESQAEGQNEDQEDSREPDACAHVCTAESGCVTLVLDCRHAHDETCGYIQADPGAPCAYICNLCPIEELIAALPRRVTADNAAEVQARLDEILALYRELTEEEQDQIDLSRCYELQEALDAASAPELLAGDVFANYQKAEWNGSEVIYSDATENTCTAVTEDTATWDAGWYVVNSNVMISERITVSGDVHLILEDGYTLTASQGITVSSGNSLTIYGQAQNTGKLVATGATYCAGIGGGDGQSSGTITIYGGTVEATGGQYGAGIGGSRFGAGSNIIIYGGTVEATGGEGGAGIGGGCCKGNGSGITIYGGTVTAKGGEGDASGAGIGGGGGSGMTSGGTGSNIEISGGTVTATGGNSGAGIGGGYLNAGSGITISGGTVTATSGTYGAGIGGGNMGAGSNITISGGEVTAKGGDGGTGIGGGNGGGGSDITISGGTVTATSDGSGKGIGGGNYGTSTGFSTGDDGSAVIFTNSIGDTSGAENWSGVIFQGNEGQVYGDVTLTEDFEIPSGKTLTIPDGSSLTIPDGKTLTIPAGASVKNEGDLAIAGGELSGGGTLTGDGAFTEDLTPDMIIVSTGRYYTPGLTATELEGKISISGGSKTILDQTFTVDPDDWTLSVTRVSDVEYTATYTNNSNPNKTVSKTITFLQSGTTLEGVATYESGGTSANVFAYGDIITVKARPTATGAAPLMAASLDEPAAGQMAVYYNSVQVSAPSTVADGVHTMTVDTASMGLTEQDLNKGIPLTVKYIASPAMAGANSTVEVTVTAAAKVEKNGATSYVGNLQDAFVAANSGATVTLLDNVTLNGTVTISSGTFTLDLNGKTLTDTASGDPLLEVGGGTLTIIDGPGGGEVTSATTLIGLLLNGGTVHLNGGSFACRGAGVQCMSGTLYVSGNAMIGYAGSVRGLNINPNSSLTVRLSGGTYNGTDNAGLRFGAIGITSSVNMTVGDLLAEGYAYFDENGAPILDSLDKNLLPGPITVKKCNHEGVISYQSNNNGTHTLTCRACGYSETANCACILGGTVEGTTVYPTEMCGFCGYTNALGYVTVTIPKLIYGETAGKKDEFKVGTDIQFDSYQPLIDIDGIDINSDYFEQKLAGLSAGEYEDRLKLRIYRAGTGGFRFPIPFTIEKAELTESMVTLAQEDITYTGAAQKPAVTVKQGTTTLTEGTDYTVSYSGNDFTNTGTVTVTVTGKGNYTGTAQKTYTISQAPLTVTDATVQTKPYDGSDTATITGVTFSGLADGETLTLGTDYTATGTFDNANAGTDRNVTVTVTLIGTAKANNYTLGGTTFTAKGTIEKAESSITTLPSASEITFGQTLSGSSLTGGQGSCPGTFAWEDSTFKPNAGTAPCGVIFTPKDSANYNAVKGTVSVAVAKAALNVTVPTASSIEYGQALSDSTLSGGTATNPNDNSAVSGTWTWRAPNETPTAQGEHEAVFTPNDKNNYETPAPVSVSVGVTAATPKISIEAPAYQIVNADVKVTVTAANPHNTAFTDVPAPKLTYKIGDGPEQEITGNSFHIPEGTEIGAVITITAATSAVAGKYEAATQTATVTVTDKTPVTIAGVSAQDNITYNGSGHTGYTGSPTAGAYTGAFSVTYTGRNGTSYNSTEPPVNAGSYTVTIAVPDDNEYFVGSIALDFTIAPKTLEWDATKLTAAKKCDGTNSAAPVLGELAVSGALSGDTVVFSYTGLTAPAFTSDEAHSEDLTLTVTGAALTGADAANYALPGTSPVITAAIHAVETGEVSGSDELRLEVETGLSTVPDALKNNPALNTPEKIETALRTKVAEVLSNVGEQIVIYDVTLQYKDSNGQWRDVDPDDFPEGGVTAILPYPAGTGATGYTFTVQHLISSGDQAGTMETLSYTLTPDGLQCRFTSLSPVAIGYQAATKPVPPPDSGGNYGGNYGGVSTYAVTVKTSTHGTVTSNRTNASSGTTVTLTVTPDSGYVLDTLTVTDSRGNEVKLTAQANGKYTFTMPSRAVTVTAAFAPIPGGAEKPCDGGADCPSRGYTDLGGVGTWYHEAVDYVLRNGLMSGYGGGLFGPNDTLSRAQLAQILYNKEGRPSVIGGSVFTDVPDGAWCADAITWAAQNGIVSGYGNGLFGPNDNITREQLAVMLWRYAGSPAATNKELHFTDADEISGYALNALRWAVENGVLNGYGDGRLGPKGQATRAQVAQMLKNRFESKAE